MPRPLGVDTLMTSAPTQMDPLTLHLKADTAPEKDLQAWVQTLKSEGRLQDQEDTMVIMVAMNPPHPGTHMGLPLRAVDERATALAEVVATLTIQAPVVRRTTEGHLVLSRLRVARLHRP